MQGEATQVFVRFQWILYLCKRPLRVVYVLQFTHVTPLAALQTVRTSTFNHMFFTSVSRGLLSYDSYKAAAPFYRELSRCGLAPPGTNKTQKFHPDKRHQHTLHKNSVPLTGATRQWVGFQVAERSKVSPERRVIAGQ